MPYEEEIVSNPYGIKGWLRYLQHKQGASEDERDEIYERALQVLPGSYKLWRGYLRERTLRVRRDPVTSPAWDAVGAVYERALVYMHRMPRVWLEYLSFLMAWHAVSRIRPVTDRALQALPITQHDRVWDPVLAYLSDLGSLVAPTGISLWRRFLKIGPERREEYVDYLMAIGEHDEAAKELVTLLDAAEARDDDKSHAPRRPKRELWAMLCELISSHASEIVSIPVEPILRTGVTLYTDQVGTLWTSLGDYFIRLAQFDKARDVFEEGMVTVQTVRDFTLVFDAYVQFEDSLLSAKLQMLEEARLPESGSSDRELVEMDADLQLRFERYQALIDRRPFLVNAVLLRQNPSNVHEWLARVELYKAKADGVNVVATYSRALEAVHPKSALGPLHDIWIGFASFYEVEGGDPDAARDIYERAVAAPASSVSSLVALWSAYSELEMRVGNYEAARSVLERAVHTPQKFTTAARSIAPPAVSFHDRSLAPEDRVFKSSKLWAAYADLEEALGTPASTRAVYEHIFDLRVATPKIVLNYADFLLGLDEDASEEAFSVFERGLAMFKYPHVLPLWRAYLASFVSIRKGSSLMRARQLFQTALSGAPRPYARELYLAAIDFETQYGSPKRAFNLYAAAVDAIPVEDGKDMYQRWIKAAATVHGAPACRPIYEAAIASLPDSGARDMCLDYARLELGLGDSVRARALYVHASQFCPPDRDTAFWSTWKDFESKHGTEDTFREMLRIKRSVRAQYHSVISEDVIAAVQAAQVSAAPGEGGGPSLPQDDDQQKDQEGSTTQTRFPRAASKMSAAPGVPNAIQFVSSTQSSIAGNVEPSEGPINPNAIAMDDSSSDDDDDDDDDDAGSGGGGGGSGGDDE